MDKTVQVEGKVRDADIIHSVCTTCGGKGFITPDIPNMYNCEMGGACPNKTRFDCRMCGATEKCPDCNVLTEVSK